MDPAEAEAIRSLAWQLRDARKQQGRTLAEIADRIRGYTTIGEVSRWEMGSAVPALWKFIAWARALGFELRLTDLTSAPLTVAADSATPPPR